MSANTATTARTAALVVACSYCSADAGQACYSAASGQLTAPHKARVTLAAATPVYTGPKCNGSVRIEQAPKGPRYTAPVVKEGAGTSATFRKVRANGTTRSIPTYPAGTSQRTTAEAMASAKKDGATVASIAAGFHVSVASVRRMLQSLDLTVQQEKAAAAAEKAAATRAAKKADSES